MKGNRIPLPKCPSALKPSFHYTIWPEISSRKRLFFPIRQNTPRSCEAGRAEELKIKEGVEILRKALVRWSKASNVSLLIVPWLTWGFASIGFACLIIEGWLLIPRTSHKCGVCRCLTSERYNAAANSPSILEVVVGKSWPTRYFKISPRRQMLESIRVLKMFNVTSLFPFADVCSGACGWSVCVCPMQHVPAVQNFSFQATIKMM